MRTMLAVLVTALSLVACDAGDNSTVTSPVTVEDATEGNTPDVATNTTPDATEGNTPDVTPDATSDATEVANTCLNHTEEEIEFVETRPWTCDDWFAGDVHRLTVTTTCSLKCSEFEILEFELDGDQIKFTIQELSFTCHQAENA